MVLADGVGKKKIRFHAARCTNWGLKKKDAGTLGKHGTSEEKGFAGPAERLERRDRQAGLSSG